MPALWSKSNRQGMVISPTFLVPVIGFGTVEVTVDIFSVDFTDPSFSFLFQLQRSVDEVAWKNYRGLGWVGHAENAMLVPSLKFDDQDLSGDFVRGILDVPKRMPIGVEIIF